MAEYQKTGIQPGNNLAPWSPECFQKPWEADQSERKTLAAECDGLLIELAKESRRATVQSYLTMGFIVGVSAVAGAAGGLVVAWVVK